MRKFFVLCLLLSSWHAFGATPEGVWSGSFSVGGWHGGLQLKLHESRGSWQADAAVQPFGRLANPHVEKLRVRKNEVSFELVVEKERLHFQGSIHAGHLQGTVRKGGAVGRWSTLELTGDLGAAQLPPPTGPYPVGRISVVWSDPQRHELAAPNSNLLRRLMIYLWYPAAHTDACDPAPYLPDLADMKTFLPKEVATSVPQVRISACSNAPVSNAKAQYPVLIFAGGDEFKTLGYSALQIDLASHGYIVAAIDFPYNAPLVLFPDGTKVTHVEEDAPLPAELPNSQEDAKKRQFDQTLADLDYWAHDIAFVQRQLSAVNQKPGSPFHNRIDVSRIGAFGHSRGGLAAFRACQLDNTIRACANLDGRYRERPYPLSSATEPPHQPFLWVRGPVHVFTDEEMAQMGITRQQFQHELALRDSIMSAVGPGSGVLYIDEIGFDHLDFTDFRILEDGVSSDDRAAREHVLAMTRLYLRAFFDNTLEGNRSTVLWLEGHRHFPDAILVKYSPRKDAKTDFPALK